MTLKLFSQKLKRFSGLCRKNPYEMLRKLKILQFLKNKKLEWKGPFEVQSRFFFKCMSEKITNITMFVIEPNFTCSQNAVAQR